MKQKKRMRIYPYITGLLLAAAFVLCISGNAPAWAAEDMTAVTIDGIQYNLARKHYAVASIDAVRGEDLKTELHIPGQVEYRGETYEVKLFNWGDKGKYSNNNYSWKKEIIIPDKEHSYFSRLQKITFAPGVLVKGFCYGYEQLKEISVPYPDHLLQAYYNNCPKLESLYLPAKMTSADIKNCPSLRVTVDPDNKFIMATEDAIYSRDGKRLYTVYRSAETYRVREGVRWINVQAFWGDTTIRHLYLPDSLRDPYMGIDYIVNLESIHFGNKLRSFNFESLANTRRLKRIDFPKNVWKIRGTDDQMQCVSKVYIRAKKLHKNTYFNGNTKKFTFYVKNKTVKKQLHKSGFKGKIVIKKNMK